MSTELDREEFKNQALKRDKHRCVFCGEKTGVTVHHILDRKLWPDRGGYYLSNAATVCEKHHWQTELTNLSVDEVRKAAKIECPELPPGFDPANAYDKWGNTIMEDGSRVAGPLFHDDGCQKALKAGHKLNLFYGSI